VQNRKFCRCQSFTRRAVLLLESVSGFEFAAVHAGLVSVHSCITTRPTQEEVGSERENDGFPSHIRLQADALCIGG